MVTVRAAKARDIDGILKVHGSHQGHQIEQLGMIKSLANYPAVVAETDGRIVGYAISALISRDLGYIESVMVHRKFRGQGVGTRLLGLIEKDLELMCDAVILYDTDPLLTPPGFSWFERRGYTITGMTLHTRVYWKNLGTTSNV